MAHLTVFISLFMVSICSANVNFPRLPRFGRLGFNFHFPKFGKFPSPFGFTDDLSMDSKGMMKFLAKPRPGIKTKVKNETHGNTTTYTVEQNGKGYHSFSQFSASKGTPDFFTEGFSEDIESSGNGKPEINQPECSGSKPCPAGQFCNPVTSLCNKQANSGDLCQFKEQCNGDGNECIWGKCKKGSPGAPGSLCQKDDDCKGDTYCSKRFEISPFYDVCSLRLEEGASCYEPQNDSNNLFGGMDETRRGVKESKKNPCKDGLKCEPVGWMERLTCIPS